MVVVAITGSSMYSPRVFFWLYIGGWGKTRREVRSRSEPEVRDQKSEVRGRKSEVSRQREGLWLIAYGWERVGTGAGCGPRRSAVRGRWVDSPDFFRLRRLQSQPRRALCPTMIEA